MNSEGLTDRFSDQIRSVAPSCEKFNQSNSDFPLSSSGGLKRSNDRVFLKGKKRSYILVAKHIFFLLFVPLIIEPSRHLSGEDASLCRSYWTTKIQSCCQRAVTERCPVRFEKPSLSRCRTHGTATLNSLQNSILMSKQLIYSKSTRRDKTSVRRSEMEPTAGSYFSSPQNKPGTISWLIDRQKITKN